MPIEYDIDNRLFIYGLYYVEVCSLYSHLIVYIENPIGSTKILFNLISEFSKTMGYKVNIQKSMAILYTNNELSERETKEKFLFTIAAKKST